VVVIFNMSLRLLLDVRAQISFATTLVVLRETNGDHLPKYLNSEFTRVIVFLTHYCAGG
jgi:hypothetical protein